MHDRLGISWQLSDMSGWGVFGWNLTTQLLARARPRPLLLTAPAVESLGPRSREMLHPLLAEQMQLAAIAAQQSGKIVILDDTVLLHHLDNHFQMSEISQCIQGAANVGVMFLELGTLAAPLVERGNRFDHLLAGSTWCGDVMKRHGMQNVSVVLQGIDPVLFHPEPTLEDLFPGRFVVFSGGKLEFRKGQDIVLAAFRAFQERHPDALLITLWHNLWPQSSETVSISQHVEGPPDVGPDGRQRIAAWAEANGIPGSAFRDLGMVSNADLPQLMRQADVAVFPNRCEGGTNLVAMECMACGVPTVVSANTGHLDLIGDDISFPLEHQTSIPSSKGTTEGWGESSVEELVDILEKIYADRVEAARRAARGADFMARLSWRNQVEQLLDVIGEA